ncbi:hypothetical protein AK88_01648 [Plasmodium fragile]|uniref:TBC1 domain family member 23 n=1 Tax=Plasmodium fragile TaxID=5857 RepID=A0A0D9QPQ3_PLAFR|nr:uncharacterized protein AK88_01648 [Plasmodium fragile]KJP88767.1 hypothetical protein AK88_01648 [Plasmodium fragile]
MRKRKIKEKYIRALFTEVQEQEAQELRQNYCHHFNSFTTHDVYLLNGKYYRVKSEDGAGMRKTLLRCLYKHNFYVPKKIRRIIFKKFLLQNEAKDVHNFNYDVYLLLSYLKNPNVNEATQKIVDLDVFRTRINKDNEKTIYFFNLFLNYACNNFQFKYKQGLNEVLALFFYLKGKYFNLVDVYFCFQSFVERFLKEFYYDDEFFFLQISFYLFKILIKYHDPVLSEVLETNKMSPEIYAASWFLTLFASKSNLEISNAIYLIFVLERNPFFYFFFSLALLILHRNIFLCVDSSNLPELLSKINIFNKKFLKKVWSLGKFLEANTPISFVHKLFFIKNVLMYLTSEHSANSNHKKDILLDFFNSIDYMSVNAYEIIKNIFLCVDSSNLPELLSKINIFNKKFLKKVWSLGKFLEANTPISFVHKLFFIKNVLMYLTSEHSANSNHKKDILLDFFNSIDYMSVNAYEIIKNISLGKHKYIFLDIRSRKHFRTFHLKNSINVELVEGYADILRDKIDSQDMQKKQKKKRKKERGQVSQPISHILKRFGSREVSRNAGLLFSYLLRKKYNLRGGLSYDDNILLTRVAAAVRVQKGSHLNFSLLGRNTEKRCGKGTKGRAKRKQEQVVFPNLHLLRGDRNAEVDLNAFTCNIYARRKPSRGVAKSRKCKSNMFEHGNMKYVEERKVKNEKRYHSDDDILSKPFSLACYHMKKGFLSRMEEELRRKGDQVTEQSKSKCMPSVPCEEKTEPTYPADQVQNLNTSSFNLYMLIKEKVLCNEGCLRFRFEDVLTPEKQVVILYDDNIDNAKYVRGFYYELLFNTKLRQVSIIEGGINSYHNLMRVDSSYGKTNSVGPSFLTTTCAHTNDERSTHAQEAPHLYTQPCLLGRNKKTIKKFFHPNHSCYLCDYKHFRKTKKKILDDCFFESYSNFFIFEKFFSFLNDERDDISFSSFYDYIIWMQSKGGDNSSYMGGGRNKSKDNGEGSSFTFSGLLNYIKRKKSGGVNDPSVFGNGQRACPHGEGGGDTVTHDLHKEEAHVSSFVAEKKISESTNGDIHICNNAKVKKHYFSLNHYMECCNRKKSDLFNVPSSVQPNADEGISSLNPPHVSGTLDEKEEGEQHRLRDEVCTASLGHDHTEDKLNVCTYGQWGGDVTEEDHTEVEAALVTGKVDSFADFASERLHDPPNRGYSIGSDHIPEGIKRSCSSSSDVYNLYSYIDIVCYRSLLLKGGQTKGGGDPHRRRLYSCFITYIYQPLIPHNIRSNNIISNLVHYVKYFKCIKRGSTAINDPNLYLQCNKLDSNLSPFKVTYFPFRSMHLLPSVRADMCYLPPPGGAAANTASAVNASDQHYDEQCEERVNDFILSNTCLKNKPELGLCKLMIYDNLLVLYGMPYLYEVTLPGRRGGAEAANEMCAQEGSHATTENCNEASGVEEQIGEALHLGDIGTINFLKEKEEYLTGGTDHEEWYLSCEPGEELQKVLIHKHKDLKKKDVLFNMDSYKINAIDINWANISPHVLGSITREHITDTYNYYKSYFSVSSSNLSSSNEQSCPSVSSSLSSDTSSYSSCVSEEPNFSFSDYHNLYTKNAKMIRNEENKRKERRRMNRRGGRTSPREDGEAFHTCGRNRKAKIDVVNIYAVFDIHTLCKITTTRGSGRTLYFYFATNRSTPLMVLNFDSDMEVQSCVRSIREVYSRYANGERGASGEAARKSGNNSTNNSAGGAV